MCSGTYESSLWGSGVPCSVIRGLCPCGHRPCDKHCQNRLPCRSPKMHPKLWLLCSPHPFHHQKKKFLSPSQPAQTQFFTNCHPAPDRSQTVPHPQAIRQRITAFVCSISSLDIGQTREVGGGDSTKQLVAWQKRKQS